MQKIFLKTYGCTLNRSDSDLIEGLLTDKGYAFVGTESEADAIIVNTCAVKETTENKTLFYLQKIQKMGKKVIVAGCLPPVNLQAVKRAIPNAAGYLGPNSVTRIPLLLENSINGYSSDIRAISDSDTNPNGVHNHIELKADFSLKFPLQKLYGSCIARIQTSSGCLSNCTFCATKIARGGFKSKPPSLILNEARMAIKNHAKEIQLASQDNGCYGYDLQTDMPSLMRQLNDLDGRFRIRVGMANPQHFLKNLDDWISAFKLPKVYKFLHLPFQSGSNRVLKEMLRGYSVEEAISVAREFRSKIPNLTLETDMIVGFPGETEEEFQMSLEICRRLQFDVVNFAKYSKRKGTRAAKMRQFHSSILKERAEIMNKVVKEIALEQNQQYVGAEYPDILVTEKVKNGFYQGRNINYKAVLLKGDGADIGSFVEGKIAAASITSLIAE
ncbi:MAG TPA: tRNA (N(6)-L-threonylcarbamoyladenosine(37)-C(2))-methylthiotransferase [Candidatus Norongarragalinales archaeon]|nr:tRNA (N(6)-L-threonylcarbamoyladenosine(37)-C(2))-methylthiotransferase [Candidatus Norongarragalinales archaeon]